MGREDEGSDLWEWETPRGLFLVAASSASQGVLSRDPYRVLVDVLVDLPVRFQETTSQRFPQHLPGDELVFTLSVFKHFPGSTRVSKGLCWTGFMLTVPMCLTRCHRLPMWCWWMCWWRFSPCVGG